MEDGKYDENKNKGVRKMKNNGKSKRKNKGKSKGNNKGKSKRNNKESPVNELGVLCNAGAGRHEANAMCRYFGFNYGMFIDPYTSFKVGLLEMRPPKFPQSMFIDQPDSSMSELKCVSNYLTCDSRKFKISPLRMDA